jgi:hypothetical protein
MVLRQQVKRGIADMFTPFGHVRGVVDVEMPRAEGVR